MIEAVSLDEVINVTRETADEFVLEQLLSRLFLYGEVEFFDAEPDEEFFKILDNSGKLSPEEQRGALGDFKRSLGLGDRFEGEYAKLGEIVVHSDDFEEHGRIPLLVFPLSNGNVFTSSTADSFSVRSFDVVYSGNESFVIVLYVKNTSDNHMEIYLRFPRQEAVNVVRTILRVFEDYIGYDQHAGQKYFTFDEERQEDSTDLSRPNCYSIPACHSFKFQERNVKDSIGEKSPQYFN